MKNKDIKLVKVSEEQKAFFAGLDPFGMLERERRLPEVVIGAVSEDEDGNDIPLGLMILGLHPRIVLIYWIYTKPECRGAGIGDAMLNLSLSIAKEGGKKIVAAFLSHEYGRSYICPNEKEYLMYNGFSQFDFYQLNAGKAYILWMVDSEEEYEEEAVDIFKNLYDELQNRQEEEDSFWGDIVLDGEKALLPERCSWEYTAEEISKSPLVEAKKSYNKALAISQISLPLLGECINRCQEKHPYDGRGGKLDKLPVDYFDMELSSCLVDEGKVSGIFLVHKNSDVEYQAEYLFNISSNSQAGLLQMLRRSATAFVTNAVPNARVKVTSQRAAVKKLLESIFNS